MIKIRLMRIGAKKRPFYRVVVVDERAKRTGGYIELLGTYNPLTEPKDIKLKQDRIDYWTKQGAQMSTGFLRIIGKAPQRRPRKPKKSVQVKTEEPKAEEKKAISAESSGGPKKEPTAPEAPAETAAETPNTEKEEVVDDSAAKTESKDTETSESVQNKKDEGST